MTPGEMKSRLRAFALRCIKLANAFPRNSAGSAVALQLTRSSTGAAANYRAACLGRSRADFIAKLKIVEEELDESIFWVDLAPDAGLVKRSLVKGLLQEGHELLAIIVQSLKTAKCNKASEGKSAFGGPTDRSRR
jgi:four helix bundle protein